MSPCEEVSRIERYNESVIEHLEGDTSCGISTGERTLKAKLGKLADAHPDEVRLVAENPDGSVFYKVPWKWISVRPPIKRNYSEEQIKAFTDRLRGLSGNTA